MGEDRENALGRVFIQVDGEMVEMVSLQNLPEFIPEVELDAEFSKTFKSLLEPISFTIYFKRRPNNWRKLHGLPMRRRRR